MADNKYHIIVTGESGDIRNLVIRKKSVRNFICISVLLVILLVIGSIQGIKYFQARSESYQLAKQLRDTTNTLQNLRSEKHELISRYESDIKSLQQEKANLLEGSISRLDERSKIIKTVMDHIGVEVKIEEDPKHSGGPFLSANNSSLEKLIYRTDRYLEILNKMPLGVPVPGSISSGYGFRSDPLVDKTAFHAGIDFRGSTGDPVHATADGVVKRVGRTKGRGNYITIAHGNGYDTHFCHLSKQLVKQGDVIERGQVVGLIGNTGRSTGSHLHYEIRYHGKTIDPMKFLQVANLSVTVNN